MRTSWKKNVQVFYLFGTIKLKKSGGKKAGSIERNSGNAAAPET